MAPYPAWPLMVTIALTRVLLVIGLLFGALPWILFPRFPDRDSAGLIGRGAIFMFGALTVVHFLGFIRLYEGLLLLALLFMSLAWRFYFSQDAAIRKSTLDRLGIWALQVIDRVTGRGRGRFRLFTGLEDLAFPRPRVSWAEGAVVLVIFGVVSWMVFGGAYRHAAPAFSDAPVTLKWMKAFGVGEIYVDGVYPQGMYGFLSLVRKFSAQNDFLVMSVTGPLVGVGLVAVLAAFLRWSTSSTLAAGMGALLYGTLPGLLPLEYARHVGYNSQEFGGLFALPAAWFAFQYLRDGNRWYGMAAAAAAGVTVFVHPVAAVVCVGLLAGAGAAAVALKAFTWRRVFTLLGWGTAAGVIALLPPVIGLTVKKLSWHGASEAFLSEATVASLFIPPVLVLVAVGAGLLTPVLLRRLREHGIWLAWFVALAAMAVWLLPHLVPQGPLNTLAYRSGEAGAMGIAIAVGIATAGLERHLPERLSTPVRKAALLGAVAAACWVVWPPSLPQPPRVSTNDEIIQALRIDRELLRSDWLLIMDQMGYSLALEHGYHQYPKEFLASVRLTPNRACWEENGKLSLLPRNVALFLDQTEEEYLPLKAWVDKHKGTAPLSQIFAGESLEVWLLSYKADPKAQFDAVWGTSTSSLCKPGADS